MAAMPAQGTFESPGNAYVSTTFLSAASLASQSPSTPPTGQTFPVRLGAATRHDAATLASRPILVSFLCRPCRTEKVTPEPWQQQLSIVCFVPYEQDATSLQRWSPSNHVHRQKLTPPVVAPIAQTPPIMIFRSSYIPRRTSTPPEATFPKITRTASS